MTTDTVFEWRMWHGAWVCETKLCKAYILPRGKRIKCTLYELDSKLNLVQVRKEFFSSVELAKDFAEGWL